TGMAAASVSKYIVGVNIVGEEATVVSMRDYRLHMQMFRYLKQRFPKVRLAMHAGELAVGAVPPTGLRFHIRDAIDVAGAERIGHGLDVLHETDAVGLMRTMREKNIPVEINLTSNQFILGVQGAEHPVSVYLRQQVPIVISSDDAGVSRNQLSGEYVLFASRYKPSYETVKTAAYNSIRYSFLNAEQKAAQTRILDQRYARFEAEMAKLAGKSKWKAPVE
ncbi:MAG TPA: adenosine deaminase, partial [Burkholderiaceae bacterium]